MLLFLTLLGCFVSTISLGLLVRQNPRRRRAHGLPKLTQSGLPATLLIGFAVLPGVALAVLGQSAGFVVWLGATSILGWLVAAYPPSSRTTKSYRRRELNV